jgi:hypothetical protein
MAYKSSLDQRRYSRAHYEANKADYVARARAHTKKNQQALKAHARAAKDVPCTDCGNRYPSYVMQFDHLGDKKFDIATAVQQGWISLKRLRREIAKCEVVCANCHAERTHQRRQQLQVAEADDCEEAAEGEQSTLF